MAKVKIYLDEGETIQDAEEQLRKALDLHSSGDIHVEESFDDPAMIHAEQEMVNMHKKVYDDMMKEIIDIINGEY
jgi:hypothetical protein